jgi:hypothetical protein
MSASAPPRARGSPKRSSQCAADDPGPQQMNKAVSIDKQSASSAAAQFLKANGLG